MILRGLDRGKPTRRAEPRAQAKSGHAPGKWRQMMSTAELSTSGEIHTIALKPEGGSCSFDLSADKGGAWYRQFAGHER